MVIVVAVVVDMTDAQAVDYAEEFGLSLPPRRTEIADHVRAWMLGDLERGPLGEFAELRLRGGS